jgi:hypothetical protein
MHGQMHRGRQSDSVESVCMCVWGGECSGTPGWPLWRHAPCLVDKLHDSIGCTNGYIGACVQTGQYETGNKIVGFCVLVSWGGGATQTPELELAWPWWRHDMLSGQHSLQAGKQVCRTDLLLLLLCRPSTFWS